ncbi:AraC family transcriptional regulator [Sulfitobacter sp. S190]|uniref:helix-turn-helix domain-containing protein n=1 Tax=Sulfitobacter sp. S190 TaxID=2867022 RepID=UPI0021A47B96|nr:AraC family transcriptional regulator [Sulfitobacter sp. S190]UWR24284.1 AraC family transcriptional regulator [Sulfitobacter sp. S190]
MPLSLFSACILIGIFVWFARSQDLEKTPHRLFLVLIGLYALQSCLITLRWGYGVEAAGRFVAFVAPVLPVVAYLAYVALKGPVRGRRLWPFAVLGLCWCALLFAEEFADGLILLAYLGFGGLLVATALRGVDQVALSPLGQSRQIVAAMAVTGATLIASGLTDIYIIFDFITTGGETVGFTVGVLQSLFVVLIGASAAFGRVSVGSAQAESDPEIPDATVLEADAEIIARLDTLFTREGLHRSKELSLRRLSRKLGLPDRQVSNAINRSAGLSVSQFVNEYRVKDACQLLKSTDDTILTVSLAAGFATKSNFNREFARVCGVSPSQWRKQH